MHHFQRWREAIQAARDPTAVASVINEYVSCILPSDIAALPPVCQAVLADPVTDIPSAAVSLLHAELLYQGPNEAAELLHELSHTFIAASARLAQIHGPGSQPA